MLEETESNIISTEDITEQFFTACEELNFGELSKYESYNLSDAMSAIELMDPKMDSGMEPLPKDLGLATAIEKGILNTTNMNFPEFIATYDANISMLISWLHFQPLDQTVFTNICLHNPEILKDPLLNTTSFAFLCLVNCLKGYITCSSVINEEDFCSNTCLKLEEFDEECISKKLELGIKLIAKELKKKDPTSAYLDAIQWRLELLFHLFEMFKHLLPPMTSTMEDIFVPNFKKSQVSVSNCLLLVKKVVDTISLGFQPPNNLPDGNFSWLLAFQPYVNLRQSTPSFPRELNIFSRSEAYSYFQKLLISTADMISLVPKSIESIDGLMTFFRTFGDENSCVFLRSLAQLVMMPNDFNICGIRQLSDIIYTSIVRPDSAMETSLVSLLRAGQNVQNIHETVHEFISFCVRAFVAIFQTFGHNLARQRDKLLRANFEDLGVLHGEAEKIEMELGMTVLSLTDETGELRQNRPIFSTFLLQHTLELMHYHFELGFKLKLFVPYEFSYVYWYFGEHVCKKLANITESKCNEALVDFRKVIAAFPADKKKSGKVRQLKVKAETELRKVMIRHQHKILIHRMESALALAFFRFSAGLMASGGVTNPAGERLRYQKRFDAFAPLPPPLFVSYNEYQVFSGIESLKGSGSAECFSAAAEHFEQALDCLKTLAPDDETQEGIYSHLLTTTKKNKIVAELHAFAKINKKVFFDYDDKRCAVFPLIKLQ